MYRIFLTLFILILFNVVEGQNYFRIEADISIKTKLSDGTSNLVMGKVYFDKNLQKLVYDIKFPEKEVWVIHDTNSFTIVEDKLVKKESILPMVQFTIFNIILEGNLANFGLNNSFYKAVQVEKDEGLVITTWEAPSNMKIQMGKIMTSTKNKDLYGVVMLDVEGHIVSKQLYKNYITIEGIRCPGEIIHVIYKDGNESYQVLTFTNIKINNLQNENLYNYRIPSAR